MGGSARSPREDKDRDYRRQTTSASSFGFRRHWSRRKGAVHRTYRRAESIALSQVGPLLADDLADGVTDDIEARVAAAPREREQNWNRSSLGNQVVRTLIKRFLDMVDTYSVAPYDPRAQRARTERALTEITRPRPVRRPDDGTLRRPVLDLNALLPEPVALGRHWPPDQTERRREWFAAFLADAPGWEPRLVRWVADRASR